MKEIQAGSIGRLAFIVMCAGALLTIDGYAQTSAARSNRISLRGKVSDSANVVQSGAMPSPRLPIGTPSASLPSTPAPASKLPSLAVQIGFTDLNQNNILDAGEAGTIRVSITNEGKAVASKLQLRFTAAEPLAGVRLGVIPKIGDLAGGASRVVEIPIEADESTPSRKMQYRIEVLEDRGFDLDPPASLVFPVREFVPPRIVLADYAAEGPNGVNIIRPKDIVEVTARIQNRGGAAGKNVSVDISPGENVFLEGDTQTHRLLGDLQPGQYKDIKFSCYANNRATSVAVNFAFKEARGRFDTTGGLTLALNKPQKKAMEFIAEAKKTGAAVTYDAPSLAVDVDVNIPRGSSRNPDAFAVVIGNSEYSKTKKVDYAVRDATSMRRYLTDVFGFKEDNIVFLTDITKSDFELYFGTRENYQGKLFNMIKPKVSDVFIFYSGHGAPGLKDHKGYFVPVECDPNYVELQGYSSETLYGNLSKMEAKSFTIVMDACFSGAELVKNVSPLLLKVEVGAFPIKNGVVISSSKNDQVSSWYAEKQHGMFTYFFLKGIHDRAADLDKDGTVTVDEMYSYLSNRSEGVPYFARRVNGIEQTPTIMGESSGKVLLKY